MHDRYELDATLEIPRLTMGRRAASLPQLLLRNLALQDYVVLGLIAFLSAKVVQRVDGFEAHALRIESFGMLSTTLLMFCLTRGEILAAGPLRSLIYRAGMFITVAGSYFILRIVLPALHPRLLDMQLLHIDERLLRETPADWLDRFVSPSSVEWFAFFYFWYYALLAVHVLGTLVMDQGRRRYELLFGITLVASIGHALYTFVPGAGPYSNASLHLLHPLVGGVWWARVLAAVSDAGAVLDIFPSLHTGFSFLIALHVFRHRDSAPYRFTWLPTCFAVANIIVATVFLRWHYGVDVLAGMLLAFCAQRIAIHAWPLEAARVFFGHRQQVWEPVFPGDMDQPTRSLLIGLTLIQLAAIAVFVSL